MSYQKLFDTKISSDSVKAWKASGKKVWATFAAMFPRRSFTPLTFSLFVSALPTALTAATQKHGCPASPAAMLAPFFSI